MTGDQSATRFNYVSAVRKRESRIPNGAGESETGIGVSFLDKKNEERGEKIKKKKFGKAH